MKKIHRFLLPTDLAHQIRDVLKLKPGEEIDLIDGQGAEARAAITAIKPSVEIEIKNAKCATTEPATKVVLYCAVLKRENFELVVQKATEVGAAEIVPIITARTVKTGIKRERLQKIAAEAAEQSGRATVPTIHPPMKFAQALIDAARNDQNVVLHIEGGVPSPRLSGSVGLFIGPEGGWTDQEIKQATEAGCTPATLGPRILRAETAAIIGVYLATR